MLIDEVRVVVANIGCKNCEEVMMEDRSDEYE
jgi:hypothetical protein